MIAKYLWITGSLLLIVLATIHLLYIFFTDKFSSRNETVIKEMKTSFPNLTKKTTFWKAWIGFNASHGSGIMFIGVINFYFALKCFTVLQNDHFYFLFSILTIGFYVWLAKKYWFKKPLIGVSIVLVCYIISYFLTLMK